MADSSLRGRYVWHELMTTDLPAALRFYRKVVGWQAKPWDKGTTPYTMLVMGNRRRGGSMPRPDEAKSTPPLWFTYVGTPDVDATARQVQQLGGTVHRQPADIPEIGRFAIVADPQGAVFCIFTPLLQSTPTTPENADRGPEIGDFSWHELITTNWQGAWDFYQKLFGWKKTSSMQMGPEMGPNATYQMFGWNKTPQGGMFNKPANMPGPPMWLPYVLVRDAKGAVATINEAGGKVINGPMEVPGGDWIVQGVDPQGAMFALHSRKPADSQGQAKGSSKPAANLKPAAKAKSAAKRKPARKTAAKAAKPARKSTSVARSTSRKKKATRKSASKARAKSVQRARKRARRR